MKFPWIRKRKMNRRQEGSSMVSVIIGVMFLAAIGLTVMTVSTRYIVSVFTARNSSDNFYEAEGILTEVRTGLIEYASLASKDSYEEILQNYIRNGANAKMKYSEHYMNKLVGSLTGDTTFDVASEVNESVPSKSYKAEKGVPVANINKLTQVPEAVKTELSTKADFYDFDIQFDKLKGYTLILRNLDIDYTDEADYRSQVSTDVVFATPDYKFDGDSTFNELKNYLIITDGILSRKDNTNTGLTTFSGNIYTGGAASKTSTDKPDTGINIEFGMKVGFNAERIISRGSLDIYSGSDVTVNGISDSSAPNAGDLWLQNIRLKNYGGSSLATTLKIFENSYVSNDLDIEDSNASVYLAGTYYGYSYNESNRSSDAATNAEYSSAVLVNGLNTSLYTNWDPSQDAAGGSPDIPALDKLILAGHTFVERDTNNFANAGNDDIGMGESIAVKSDQIAYMVPDDYLVGIEHNPVLEGEYENKAEFLNNVKNALLGSPLKEYLNTTQPYIENHISSSGTDVMYLFLNFKDLAAANQYFYDYFAGNIPDPSVDEGDSTASNKDLLKDRAQAYLQATNINATFSPNLYLLAGCIAYNYDATDGTQGIQSPNYFTSGNDSKPKEVLLEDARKMAASYYAYCMSLTNASADIDTIHRIKEGEEKLVAQKLLDMSKLDPSKVEKNTADVSKVLVQAVNSDYNTGDLMDTGIQTKAKGIIVASGNVIIDKPCRGLIIAGGDVTVQSDFEGLIIAEGKVDVTRDTTLKSDIVIVSEMFDYIKSDPALAAIFNALNGTLSDDATELEQCISYQNWAKDIGTAIAGS